MATSQPQRDAVQAAPAPATSAPIHSTYLGLIAASAALGGLLFGWDWVVIGGAKPFFERYFHIQHDASLSGWANSCALAGCLLGSLGAGMLADRHGRKPLLALAALLFTVSSIGDALSQHFVVFILWRILGGVAIGLASNLSPLYISEIAPAHLRGRLVSINQLTIVVGILGAQIVNWWLVRDLPPGADDALITHSWFGQVGWRWMFGITAIPAVLFMLGMLLVPESPRWLVQNARAAQARRTLERIGGSEYAQREIAAVTASLQSRQTDTASLAEILQPRVRRAMVLGIVLAVFQQWCGINVIFNYAEEIFRTAGYDISSVLTNIIWTGSVNLVFTLLALGVIDKAGRRPLMLLGSSGLCVVYLLIGACYALHLAGAVLLMLVLAAIGCYAISLAPVTWVVIAEIFPNRIRATAMSVAVTALWAACFVLTYTFPTLNASLGPAGTFWLYAAICFAGAAFIWKALRETKGRSLEAIERELEQ